MIRQLTGRHVLAIAICSFAVIVGANMAMLFAATGSFPGLVVKNSYVASQKWNDEAQAQQALGWKTSVHHAGGRLEVSVAGPDDEPVQGLAISAKIGRPTTDTDDQAVTLMAEGDRYEGLVQLAPGAWLVELSAEGRPAYRQIAKIFVKDPG